MWQLINQLKVVHVFVVITAEVHAGIPPLRRVAIAAPTRPRRRRHRRQMEDGTSSLDDGGRFERGRRRRRGRRCQRDERQSEACRIGGRGIVVTHSRLFLCILRNRRLMCVIDG